MTPCAFDIQSTIDFGGKCFFCLQCIRGTGSGVREELGNGVLEERKGDAGTEKCPFVNGTY
jgi:hypothetical protein